MNTQKDTKKAGGVCMACTCPCEKHKEHTHEVNSEKKDEDKNAAKVCSVCGSSDKSCGCK